MFQLKLQHQKRKSRKKSDLTEYQKKTSDPGLNDPSRFDILAQLVNIPARNTIHELLRLPKKTREALRDALANLESFLIYMSKASEDNNQPLCPKCHHV